MASMHFSMGIRTDDFVILASDKSAFLNGVVVSNDYDKTVKLGDKTYMTVLGKPGDAQNFSRLAQRHMNLFKMSNGYELSPKAILHCLERIIAEQGRSSPIGLQPKIFSPQNPILPPLCPFPDVGNPGGFPSTNDTPPSYGRVAEALRSEDYSVEVLLGGYDDKENKAWLSTIDYLGNAIEEQNYLFCRSFTNCRVIMDTLYNPAMTVDEGIEAVSKCVENSRKRSVIKPLNVIIIDRNGARNLDRDLPVADFKSLFANPKKVVFAACGSSKLICFDGIYAYLVNVIPDGDDTLFSCLAVLVLEPLSDIDSDINAVKVNEDSTYVALISKKYVYVFGIPDVQKGAVIPKHADLDKGVPKLTVRLELHFWLFYI
uniref:Uncharacterized protein n=1 Tax=Panagrolaimus sp. JU765 TaxID=591449 RepID=A0AC34RKT7_9BILA